MQEMGSGLRGSEAMDKLIGRAPPFVRAIEQLPLVAASDATVLIVGETGTGKELIARAIHYQSKRSGFPFVTLNCGSLSDTLIEDELFGHERGAFTTATARREGLLAHAECGTLFLDEIDCLPAKGQVDLLRVLQEKTYRRVGSSSECTANVRILAATNAQLAQLVRDGSFRADLYHRLNIFRIDLPPLRERMVDIPPLAEHFLEKHAPECQPTLSFSEDAYKALVSYDWPGNVRELENAVLRAVHLRKGDRLRADDLGLQVYSVEKQTSEPEVLAPGELRPFKDMKQEIIRKFEREYLIRLMWQHRGNVSHAAEAARKERRDLGKLLRKHELDPREFISREQQSSAHPARRLGEKQQPLRMVKATAG